MKYKFFDHTADVMFEAYGNDLDELFENAALAVEEIMVKLSTLGNKSVYTIKLSADSLEDLLYDFLSELIFVKDTEGLLFNKFEINISEKNNKYSINAKCFGEIIDRKKHQLNADAKAITKHKFEIKKTKDKYIAHVIVDI